VPLTASQKSIFEAALRHQGCKQTEIRALFRACRRSAAAPAPTLIQNGPAVEASGHNSGVPATADVPAYGKDDHEAQSACEMLNNGLFGPSHRSLAWCRCTMGSVHLSVSFSILWSMSNLAGYSDKTLIKAELPDKGQTGEFLLRRDFWAPRSLAYSAVSSRGDGFVRHQVIARLLDGEVSKVQKGESPSLTIIEPNYKFSFKGVEDMAGRPLYVFDVKPRRKKAGLFKGKILIDCRFGHIVRAMGKLCPSPSWWIKKVEFVQDYTDVDNFTLPIGSQVNVVARIVGRISITILHSGYRVW